MKQVLIDRDQFVIEHTVEARDDLVVSFHEADLDWLEAARLAHRIELAAGRCNAKMRIVLISFFRPVSVQARKRKRVPVNTDVIDDQLALA
jgi:hypothetical protein